MLQLSLLLRSTYTADRRAAIYPVCTCACTPMACTWNTMPVGASPSGKPPVMCCSSPGLLGGTWHRHRHAVGQGMRDMRAHGIACDAILLCSWHGHTYKLQPKLAACSWGQVKCHLVPPLQVRRSVASGKPIRYLVLPEVEDYVREHGLYTGASPCCTATMRFLLSPATTMLSWSHSSYLKAGRA